MLEIKEKPSNCNDSNKVVAKVYSCNSDTFTISCNLCEYVINSFKRFQTHYKKHQDNIGNESKSNKDLQAIAHVEIENYNTKLEETIVHDTSDVEVDTSICLISREDNKWEEYFEISDENMESLENKQFFRLDIELDEKRMKNFQPVNNFSRVEEEYTAAESDIETEEDLKEAEIAINVMDSTSNSESIDAGYKKQKRKLVRAKPRCNNNSSASYFNCSYCDKIFNNNSNRKMHELRHSTVRPYLCDTCAKSFYTQGELDVHNLYHNDERPFVCEECGKGFRRSWVLKKHRRTHGTHEATLPCPKCNKLFSFKDNLRNHMQIHNTVANIICEFCDEAFTHRKKYRRHVLKKHTLKQLVK